jgi:hypothetical protein
MALLTRGTLLGVDEFRENWETDLGEPIFRVAFLGDSCIWGKLRPRGGFLNTFKFFDSTTLLAS